jgi:hypothetical protein
VDRLSACVCDKVHPERAMGSRLCVSNYVWDLRIKKYVIYNFAHECSMKSIPVGVRTRVTLACVRTLNTLTSGSGTFLVAGSVPDVFG